MGRRFSLFLLLFLPCSAVLFSLRFVARENDPNLKAFGSQLYRDGRPFTGIVFALYPDKRPARVAFYEKGRHHGLEIAWYPDGTRSFERHYTQGNYDGVSQTWHENGRMKSWRFYKEGAADGEQWAWGTEGQVQEYNLYRSDQELAHKTWTFDGRPFHNYVYQNGEKVGIQGEPFCRRRQNQRY